MSSPSDAFRTGAPERPLRLATRKPSLRPSRAPTGATSYGTPCPVANASLSATNVIALHDLNLAVTYCDHLLVLRDGQAVAKGTRPRS